MSLMGFHSLFLFAQVTLSRFVTFLFMFPVLSFYYQLELLNWFHLALKTVEAERISVDHVAHLKPSDGGSAATQCQYSSPFSFVFVDQFF